MKMTKRLLSILLAAILLFSVLPMTALAAESDKAETGDAKAFRYSVTTAEQLLTRLDWPDADHDTIIDVDADIVGYIGVEGDSSDASYVRYGVTVGEGRKILNLNGHKVHFYNDYSVIHDHFGIGGAETNKLNRLTLINIPEGAELIVNGDELGGNTDTGRLQYHGKQLSKCDAVDQRDIFEVNGGSLTVNSGYFVAGGETVQYKWTEKMEVLPAIYSDVDYSGWYLVSGTPIRAITGTLTINGGLFEGRGLEGYASDAGHNSALRVESGMDSVIINDGHFYGRSTANAIEGGELMSSGTMIVNSGIFEVEVSDAQICTVYKSWSSSSSGAGYLGLYLSNPNPETNYYYLNAGTDPINDPAGYREATAEQLRENPYMLYYSKIKTKTISKVYVDPKAGRQINSRLSYDPTSEVKFIFNGKEYDPDERDVFWNKTSGLYLTVDPDSLYFDNQDMEDAGVEQSLTAKAEIRHFISDGNRPTVAADVDIELGVDNKGRYYLNLNTLRDDIKAQLEEGEAYIFYFTFDEYWFSRREYSIWHPGFFNVRISSEIHNVSCTLTEPAYGMKPSTEVDDTNSADVCTIGAVGEWIYQNDGDTSWTAMASGETFKNDRVYALNLMGVMQSGYTLADDAVLWVNGIPHSIENNWGTGFTAVPKFDMHVDPIDDITLLVMSQPVAGETPGYVAFVPGSSMFSHTNYDGHYSIDPKMSMTWYDENGLSMANDDTFEAGKQYTVKILVNAFAGYKFDDEVKATVNGKQATVTESWTDFMDESHARVAYTFTCPEPDEATVIDEISVSIVKPGEDMVPPEVEILSDEPDAYTAEANYWYVLDDDRTDMEDDDAFEAGKHYRLRLNVYTAPGYRFADEEDLTVTFNVMDDEEYTSFVVLSYSEDEVIIDIGFELAGDEAENYMIGDADTDEKITILDATAIQRVLASLPVASFNEKAADADLDEKLTILDATAIQRHLAALPTCDAIGVMLQNYLTGLM